jgi:tight adherence protein B
MEFPMLDLLLLTAAVAAVAVLARGPIRGYQRQRAEQEHAARLAGERADTAPRRGPRPLSGGGRLRAAGLAGPPEAYWFGTSLLSGVVSLALFRALPAFPVAALIGGVLALYVPWAVIGEMARRRALRFEHQLIDVIDLTAGALQAGGNLVQALRVGSSAAKQPLKGEFDEAFQAISVGMPVERAFGAIAERYDSGGVRLLTLTLAAKLQTGGDLAPVLRSLNDTLRDRWRQQRQVRAQLSGARTTAVGAVILPYLVAPALSWLQPGWFDVLFVDPMGPPLIFLAVALQVVGMLWIWRILTREP